MKPIYLEEPVPRETVKKLNAEGFQVLNSGFKPRGYKHPDKPAEVKKLIADHEKGKSPRRRGRKPKAQQAEQQSVEAASDTPDTEAGDGGDQE